MNRSQSLILNINLYINGDSSAGDPICAALEPQVRETVRSLLGPQDADGDDVVQDSLVAMLNYLKRAKIAPDNPEAFVVTIARNRCHNLHIWRRRRTALDVSELSDKLPHIAASPLDLIDKKQRQDLLNEALQSLNAVCRNLLAAIYRQETTIEDLRRKLGLKSVQAVYHRRNICIQKAQNFLNRRLLNCQTSGGRKLLSITAVRPVKESEDG